MYINRDSLSHIFIKWDGERGLYDYISYYKIVGVKHKNLQIKKCLL